MTVLEALATLEAATVECKQKTSTRPKLKRRWIC
jgi:hypothetical protein